MADTFQLKLLTPYKSLFEGPIEAIMLPGSEGEFGVLSNHTKFTSALQPGVIRFVADGETQRYAVGGGFAEVSEDGVVVLADSAEHPDDIDADRAEQALADTRKALADLGPDQASERHRLETKIARAENRLKIARSA